MANGKTIVKDARASMEQRGWEVVATSDSDSRVDWLFCKKADNNDVVVLPQPSIVGDAPITAAIAETVGSEIMRRGLSTRVTFRPMSVDLRSGRCVLHNAARHTAPETFSESPATKWHDEGIKPRIITAARKLLDNLSGTVVSIDDSDFYDFAVFDGGDINLVSVSSTVSGGTEARDWIVEQSERRGEAIRVIREFVERVGLNQLKKDVVISGMTFIFDNEDPSMACVRMGWDLDRACVAV